MSQAAAEFAFTAGPIHTEDAGITGRGDGFHGDGQKLALGLVVVVKAELRTHPPWAEIQSPLRRGGVDLPSCRTLGKTEVRDGQDDDPQALPFLGRVMLFSGSHAHVDTSTPPYAGRRSLMPPVRATIGRAAHGVVHALGHHLDRPAPPGCHLAAGGEAAGAPFDQSRRFSVSARIIHAVPRHAAVGMMQPVPSRECRRPAGRRNAGSPEPVRPANRLSSDFPGRCPPLANIPCSGNVSNPESVSRQLHHRAAGRVEIRRGRTTRWNRRPADAAVRGSRGAGLPCRKRFRRLAGGRPCGGGRCGLRRGPPPRRRFGR